MQLASSEFDGARGAGLRCLSSGDAVGRFRRGYSGARRGVMRRIMGKNSRQEAASSAVMIEERR
jgi:hypothetical protein